MADACSNCDSEFMIGARFCHTCGLRRAVLTTSPVLVKTDAEVIAGLWAKNVAWVKTGVSWAVDTWQALGRPAYRSADRFLHWLRLRGGSHWGEPFL
jgi:hypothetical protein